MRITTHRCHTVSHPEIVFTIADDAPAERVALVERWARVLEHKIVDDGEHHEAGSIATIARWPVRLHAGEGGLEAQELDLDPPSSPWRFLPTIDDMARRFVAQMDFADAFGVLDAIDVPNPVARILVCPSYKREGPFCLGRSEPTLPNDSGWLLRCGGVCDPSGKSVQARGGKHVPDDGWLELTVGDLIHARPGLARFLGLPVGFAAELQLVGSLWVARRRDAGVTGNAAQIDYALYQLRDEFERVDPRPESGVAQRLASKDVATIDWKREMPKILRRELGAAASLCERYAIGPEAADATIEHHSSLAMRRAYALSLFEGQISEEHFGVILELVADRDPARWRIHQAGGRKLRDLTSAAFVASKELVERIDVVATEYRLFEHP